MRVTWLPRFCVALIVLAIFVPTLFSGCRRANSIVGKWEKITGNLCGVAYPGTLRFLDDGTYTGALPIWNGGSYAILDEHQIKMDTLVGPGVYEYQVSEKILIFKNDSGCEVKYVEQ